MATNVVSFADFAFCDHLIQRTRMIFDKQPITNLHTVAIHRQRFAIKRIQNHQWNQFFRKMIRAVVVGTIGYNGRQAVSTQPCAHQMVAGGFGSRIGAGRGVRRGFGEQIIRPCKSPYTSSVEI
ncbi:hypothetical protein NM2005172_2184 [Neisseria meningitidis 2005172]|nr:hypothetical protein NM2005172_2184 [Neisseria meningitidis 2005172]